MARTVAENVAAHKVRRRQEYITLFAVERDGNLVCPGCEIWNPDWGTSLLEVYHRPSLKKSVYTASFDSMVVELESGEAILRCPNCREHERNTR